MGIFPKNKIRTAYQKQLESNKDDFTLNTISITNEVLAGYSACSIIRFIDSSRSTQEARSLVVSTSSKQQFLVTVADLKLTRCKGLRSTGNI
jgi:hypothetical protein